MAKSKNKLKLTHQEVQIRLDKYAVMSREDKIDVWNTLYIKFNNIAADDGYPLDKDYMSQVVDQYETTLLEGEQYEVLAILRDFREYHQL